MNFVVKAEITSKKMIQPNVVELIVKPDKIRPYTPGSFVQLSLDIVTASEIWPESRTFSIASYSREFMRFLIKEQGEYTRRIVHDTHIGQFVTIKYPFGEMLNKKDLQFRTFMIAGGLGITPFFSMIEYLNENGLENYHLLYSAKSIDQFIDLDILQSKVKNLHLFTSQEKSEFTPRRIELKDLQQFHINSNDHFYICGSKDFINNYKNLIIKLGNTNIHMDEWE